LSYTRRISQDTPDDEFPKFAAKTLNLRIWPPRIPTVLFIGDSSRLREAVASEHELTQGLTKYAGQDTRAKLLAVGGSYAAGRGGRDGSVIGHVRSPVVLEVSEFSFSMSPIALRRATGGHGSHISIPQVRHATRNWRGLGVSLPIQRTTFFSTVIRFFAARVDQVVRIPWTTYSIRQHLSIRIPVGRRKNGAGQASAQKCANGSRDIVYSA